MRVLNFERLKTIVRFADIVDSPIAASGEVNPEVPYEGHEGEAVVVADDGITITFDKRNYDVVAFCPGTMSAGQTVLSFPLGHKVEFPAGLANSQATLGTAATGSTVLSLKKNNTQFATCTFGAGGSTGAFAAASDTVFQRGDILTVVAPDPADDTAADLGFTLDGYKKS